MIHKFVTIVTHVTTMKNIKLDTLDGLILNM